MHPPCCLGGYGDGCCLPRTVVGHFILQGDLLLPGVVGVLHEGGAVRLEVELQGSYIMGHVKLHDGACEGST